MRINADADRCVGAGQCVLAAPDLFDQDDDGTVTVLTEPGAATKDAAREAVHLCPSGAITLEDG
ncbi:ferredoxin [Streptomyces bingchenggensis BCW-1]|uniref:Ferredoxin n=1 Tax=Streptomyces bingchenggensis (strain BCW-1) TaxID=749414 RepID=D7C2C1_STRBB|nr:MULTISPECIES: ferredoxin [Streptomyces]ADI03775.1 ferredoxin [Streptomyces bingchenggensis BCW-1]